MPSVEGMSMFHRRVLVIALLVGAGAAVPLLRLGQLTIAKGGELKSQAEARLSTRQFIATTRGKIVDRKGRVLAEDRPGFDVQVDYSLISGQWVYLKAAAAARKATPGWNELAAVQREAAVQRFVPEYQAHLDRSWEVLAGLTGIAREELEERRQVIKRRVSVMAAELSEQNRRVAEEEALERGRQLGRVNAADFERPIREQTVPHVLVRGIDDAVAFNFPGPDAAATMGLLAGMKIVDGATRVYPLEDVPVTVDRSGFPGSLRDDAPLEMTATGVATPLIGWMRSGLYQEELAQRPLRRRQDGSTVLDLGGYLDTDAIGVVGIERSAEGVLRGERGVLVEQLDTGEKRSVPRKPGRDVTLTIDAQLQARVQALVSPQAGLTTVQHFHNNKALPVGTMLPAAVVVLDVSSGDVLSMVSTPVYTRRQLREDPDSLLTYEADRALLEKERAKAVEAKRPEPGAASLLPFLNRAVGKAYAPGSIVKPLVLNFAAADGRYNASGVERIPCTGHFYPGKPGLMRCWIFKQNKITHDMQLAHALDPTEAVMVSCNIFFYTLGSRLGEADAGAGLAGWYGRLGIGDGPSVLRANLGLGYQYPGQVLAGLRGSSEDDEETGAVADSSPTPATPPVRYGDADFAMLGIGQGPIAWTPLHAADAYCTLARGGVRLTPRVRTDPDAPAQQRADLGFAPAAVALALRGLERSVNEERGTGHHITLTSPDGVSTRENTFNLPGVRVWGKSGTADSGVKSLNPDQSLDHAWFVVLVGPEGGGPKFAVAVMVENGGSGGRVAGPLCNQVIWQLKAEGYL